MIDVSGGPPVTSLFRYGTKLMIDMLVPDGYTSARVLVDGSQMYMQ